MAAYMKITPNLFSKISLASLISLTTLSGFILSSTTTHAEDDSAVDNVAITVPVACSLTPTLDSAHTATISPNTREESIGLTTLKAVCNDSSGFSIYAVGFSNEELGNTNLIGGNTNQLIATGSAASGSGNPSSWAMKVNAVTGTYAPSIENGFNSYRTVPNAWTKVATFNASTDATIGSSIQSTYAAYISGTQAADTYNGKVKYTLVHPVSEEPLSPKTTQANQICYYANASSAVGTMGCQTIASTSTYATLLASNFSRAGYGFAGWSDSYDYVTNTNAKFYGPQEYITFTAGQYSGTDEGLSLYAVWVKSQGNLQDSAKVSSICSNLDTAPTNGTANLRSISALTDQRDNETYAIAKLADGNCWMIENLRLESTNSDNTTGALAQGYGTSTTYGNFSGLADTETTNFTGDYSSPTAATEPNSLYYAGTQSGTASINISQTNYAGYRMPRYNSDNHQTTSANRPQNPTSNSASNNITKSSMYSYGNYYTWAAAIADTTYYDTNNSSVTNTSLCPKGWRLPQGGDKTRITSNDDNDFWNLTVDYLNGGTNPANYDSSTYPYYNGTAEATPVANKLRSFPNNFLYSGYFNGSSATSRGSYGYYWSSTAYINVSSYYLNLNSSNVYPGSRYFNKYSGQSIRCVASSS